MKNYLSIDFESWAYPDLPEFLNISSEERKSLDDGYVKFSAEKILKLLSKYKTKITFFIIGQLYDWYPEVIRWIAEEGHEIAYHTHEHNILKSKEILVNSLNYSIKFLEEYKPLGFRAPGILMQKNYLKILNSYGFSYDSSIYGSYSLKQKVDDILEIPISTYPMFTQSVRKKIYFPRSLNLRLLLSEPPVGSGFMIGILGKSIEYIFRLINKSGNPFVAFIHNWQIIPPQNPSFPSKKYLLTHPGYLPYIRNCYKLFESLLSNFELGKMREI